MMRVPELELPPSLREDLLAVAENHTLEELEARALAPAMCQALTATFDSPDRRSFFAALAQAWRTHDHAVVRSLPVKGGVTTLLAALPLAATFKPYRGDKIVKHFKMSPWTTELSQTLREGHFHTDLSTADRPPRVTLIHCAVPDPSPGWGAVHVARVTDLLAELELRGADETLRFLLVDEVEMVDERARGSWSGVMASDREIRYHPETLRAARGRGALRREDLEQHLALIRAAALAVSTPIELGSGDLLFVSNIRALHYRGACTVRYHEFPRRFDAREIHVLHLLEEPTWPE